MIAAWMIHSLGIGVLVGAAALAASHVFRLLRLPVRWAWLSGLVLTLVLSFGGLLSLRAGEASHAPVPLTGEVLVAAPEASGTKAAAIIRRAVREFRAGSAAITVRLYVEVREHAGNAAAAVAWAAASAALLLLFGATLLRLRRERTTWHAHVIGGVHVLVSRNAGPALVGVRRPCIVLPQWLLGEPLERQQLVVRHEDEHRRAGDHLVLAAACCMVCLLPFNPALWWMLLRLRLAVELDCDARVLRAGCQAHAYGTLLLAIAARTVASPFHAPALAHSATQLERRLIAMTETRREPRRAASALAALPALLLLAAACTTDLPTAATLEAMDVNQAQSRAEQVGLLLSGQEGPGPVYLVDGAAVTADEARALAADQIAAVEVIRSDGAGGAGGVVKITTAEAARMQTGEATAESPLTRSDRQLLVRDALNSTTVAVRAGGEQTADAGASSRPLVVIDGVVAPSSFSMNSIDPDRIERIEIVKGEAARRLYGEAGAANGAILISTRP